MRELLGLLVWLVAAAFCAVTTVVWAYMATFVGTFIFWFGIEGPAAQKFFYGSIAFFAIMSCVFLIYLAVKMTKGDLW